MSTRRTIEWQFRHLVFTTFGVYDITSRVGANRSTPDIADIASALEAIYKHLNVHHDGKAVYANGEVVWQQGDPPVTRMPAPAQLYTGPDWRVADRVLWLDKYSTLNHTRYGTLSVQWSVSLPHAAWTLMCAEMCHYPVQAYVGAINVPAPHAVRLKTATEMTDFIEGDTLVVAEGKITLIKRIQ